jgi:uncharacterized membrane protein YeaQ/YmgE (transglycosylase-associated protein family)
LVQLPCRRARDRRPQLRTSGLIGSVIGSVIALLIYRSSYRRRAY